MEELLTKRAILVTGKGGVGKTAVAAAIARFAAARGARVLVAEVASADAEAVAIARALGAERCPEEPRPLAQGIDGVLLTPSAGHRRFLQQTLRLRSLADAAMRSAGIRRFLNAAPAFAEMGVLYRMLDLLRQGGPGGGPLYDLCVVDSPATGHALAMGQLPSIVLKIVPSGPVGRAAREGLALLTDPSYTAAVVVALPESLPVSEAVELAEGLRKHRIPVAAGVMNRVPADPFTESERVHVEQLEADHGPLFGTRAVDSIDRARASVERLRRDLGVPVYTLPELAETQPALSQALARCLARAEGAGPHPAAQEPMP